VSVEGMTMKDVKPLKEKVYQLMEGKLIQYKASWIKPGKVNNTEKVSY